MRSGDLYLLYENFQAFGGAIGDNNLAVWFVTNKKSTAPNFANSVDVERSVRFCKAFKLKPTSGPHILFLTSYPDPQKPTEGSVFALGGMSPGQISALLGKITDELVIEGKITRLKPVAEPALWIRILAATQKAIRDSGCAWHLKIAAGGFDADLQPCDGPH